MLSENERRGSGARARAFEVSVGWRGPLGKLVGPVTRAGSGAPVDSPSRAGVGVLNWLGRGRAGSRMGEVILRRPSCEG